jgi:hypothetical protein
LKTRYQAPGKGRARNKIEALTIKQKVASSRVLPDGGLEIRVEAPECRCALTGIVVPAPAQ